MNGFIGHRISVIISDPSFEQHICIPQCNLKTNDVEKEAVDRAIVHYEKKGYKVHSANYMGAAVYGRFK